MVGAAHARPPPLQKQKQQQKAKKLRKAVPPPPGFSAPAEDASAPGLAAEAVVAAFVRLAADALLEDDPDGGAAPRWATYEMVAPSQLLWAMRQFVQREQMLLLEGTRASGGGGAAREHHRCIFHAESHGRQVVVESGGLSLRSGNGPTTTLSSASASEGALTWTIRYDAGNTSCMIGLVRTQEFGGAGEFDIPLDVPAWTICSAHGYEAQGHKRFQPQPTELFRCVADVDLGTFKVWRTGGGGAEGELLLDADDVEGEVSLALCTWNGATFSIVEDDDSAEYVSGKTKVAGTAKKEKEKPTGDAKRKPGGSGAGALPLATTAGLAGVCALLQQVSESDQLVELAISSVQAIVGVLGVLQPQQMLGEVDETAPLETLLRSVGGGAAASSAAGPQQQALLALAAGGLVALAAAKGREDSLLSAAEALRTLASIVHPAVHPVLVELPPVAVSLERSVRALLGVDGESLLPEPRHDPSRAKVMRTTDVAPKVVCFACDGAYMFTACTTSGIHKLGTGSNGSVSAQVYAHNSTAPVTARAWIGVIGKYILLRPDSTDPRAVVVLDAETLSSVEAMTLGGDTHTPCTLIVTQNSILSTVELRTRASHDGIESGTPVEEAPVGFEPEPEPEDQEPEPEPSSKERVGLELVVVAALRLDASTGLLLDTRDAAESRPDVELDRVSYTLELHGMVMYGQDANDVEFGCTRTFAVVGSEHKPSKFKAGDDVSAKKRPLGFQNFNDHQFYPAKVVEVNADGTIHVVYSDEQRPDKNLPIDMAKISEEAAKDAVKDDRRLQAETLDAFFDKHTPVQSKALKREFREELLQSSFDAVCEKIEARFGVDPRKKKARKKESADQEDELQHFLNMAQVQSFVRTDLFDCLLTDDLEVFRRSHNGKLGSATKGSEWQKLQFGEDDDIVDICTAADGKLILFVAASGRVWFAGDRPGADKEEGDCWETQPEVLPLPVTGGAAPAAKKKDAAPDAAVAAAAPQPGGFGQPGFGGGFAFGGGGGFGAPFGGGAFGGAGFGAAPAFGQDPAGAAKPAGAKKKDEELEFKKVALGTETGGGWRVATVADVQETPARQETARALLLEWDIVELQDGKMAGSGYEWVVMEGNTEDVGFLLLAKDDEELAASLSALVKDAPTAKPVTICCAASGAKGIVVFDNGNITVFGKDSGRGELGEKAGTTPFDLPCKVASVSMGSEHTVFLLDDGTVWCCGSNAAGQCGSAGESEDAACKLQQVDLGQTAVAVACGEHHTVVVGVKDTFSFGANGEGQLGRAGESHSLQPLELPRASSVVCGRAHTLVRTDNGVYGFGSNRHLQLGQPDKVSAVETPVVLYGHCVVGNFGAACDFTWAACSETMASFAENTLVLPRRNDALAVRAPHRFLTISADPPLEPACQSVWLILEDGHISNQVACPDDILWCATESTRDVTWLLSDHEVSSIHPLTLQGREDTEIGRQAMQLKSQSGTDISTSSDGQRLDLRNLPVWLWSHIDVLSNATHRDTAPRAAIPLSKMSPVPLYNAVRNQNNMDQGRIQYQANSSFTVTSSDAVDTTPYLLTGIVIFGGSSRMQASLTMKCGATVKKIVHKWLVPGEPGGGMGGEAPREKILFDEPVLLELGSPYGFSGLIGHDAGVQQVQYQYYNVAPQPSKQVDSLQFKFEGHGNQGDWLQTGIAELLFCVAPQADETLVRLTKELWDSSDHEKTIKLCVEALSRSWDQAQAPKEQTPHVHLNMCSQALRRLRYAVDQVCADDNALQAFGLTKKLGLVASLIHIVESNVSESDTAAQVVSDCRVLWQGLCTRAFPGADERRALTHDMFQRAFAPTEGDGMDLMLVAAFLQSTAQTLTAGADFLDICDGETHTGMREPLYAEVVMDQMLQLALAGPVAVRSAAAGMLTAIASSLALTVQCKVAEVHAPAEADDDSPAKITAGSQVKVKLAFNGQESTVLGEKCVLCNPVPQPVDGMEIIAAHPDFGDEKVWEASVTDVVELDHGDMEGAFSYQN